MQAARVELVPAVEGGLLGVVHQDELLAKAEPAGVGARSEGLATIYIYIYIELVDVKSANHWIFSFITKSFKQFCGCYHQTKSKKT